MERIYGLMDFMSDDDSICYFRGFMDGMGWDGMDMDI